MKISMLWMISMALLIIFATLTLLVKKKENESKMNWTQFECGFNTMSPTMIPFSFQFFLVSLLFLIFDVEIALVISFPMEPLSSKNSTLLYAFLTILTIGLLYEWQKSKVNWSKWMGK